MHTRVKVILIVAFVCLVAFFAMKDCHAQDALTLNVLNKLSQGYKLKAVGDNLVAYTDCDTIIKPKADFTLDQLRQISRIYQGWIKKEQSFTRLMSAEYGNIPIGTYIPPPNTHQVYFVAREGVLINAVNNGSVTGLDSAKVLNSRRSLTTAGGQYYRVVELQMNDADTTFLMNAWRNNNVYYVTPFTASLDSLRQYLNDVNSIPQWTTGE